MNRATLAILATLSLAATSLMAQSQSLRPVMTLDVPFDFVAGGKTLPAGQYIVESDRSNSVWIQSANFRTTMVLLSHSTQDPAMTGVGALKFHQYGPRYFLSQIWLGNDLGQELPKSHAEREQIASAGASHSTVSITARR